MKLVVFAHTPPPHHGQSYMVQVMLKSLGGDIRTRPAAGVPGPVECYHVNARLSRDVDDLGTARGGKVFLLLRYCFQALVLRLRYRIDALYYIPASSGRAAIYRDWIVMALCRLLFRRRIFHWHSVGWKDWVASARPWERCLSRWLLSRPVLSMVLTEYGRRDAEACRSKHVEVVPNGLPDPCPNFATEVWPRRRARLEARRALLSGRSASSATGNESGAEVFRVLFLGLCYRPKGLFDAIEAVVALNQALAGTPVRAELTVAGKFWKEVDRVDFEARLRQPDLLREGRPLVEYRGFVQGPEKHRLLVESDCLCFPTFYEMEGFPLVLVEAMAYGLPALSSRWRGVPDVLPPGYPGLVEPQGPPAAAAKVLRQLMEWNDFEALRARYTERFTAEQFDKRLLEALLSVENPACTG